MMILRHCTFTSNIFLQYIPMENIFWEVRFKIKSNISKSNIFVEY